MRVLITGGFGLIGGRLALHLQQAGMQIVLGTRQARPSPDWLPEAEVVTTNWCYTDALTTICRQVDVVIHTAGMNAQDCSVDPATALEFNGLATARLVDAATRAAVKRFIYLSTAHTYASPLSGIITEDTCPRNLHPYATSHLAGENVLLHASKRQKKLEGIVLRLSNAFGAPVHKDVNCWMLLVNDLCKQAVTTGKLVLRSDGSQQRDFITLKDTVRCIEHFVSLPFLQCSDGLFNLGGERTQSVLEMTQLVAARCRVVLGFIPHIERLKTSLEDSAMPLSYRIDKLKSTGFSLQGHYQDEIDETLSLCQMVF